MLFVYAGDFVSLCIYRGLIVTFAGFEICEPGHIFGIIYENPGGACRQ
jgi:hypothetical protein